MTDHKRVTTAVVGGDVVRVSAEHWHRALALRDRRPDVPPTDLLREAISRGLAEMEREISDD